MQTIHIYIKYATKESNGQKRLGNLFVLDYRSTYLNVIERQLRSSIELFASLSAWMERDRR